VRHKKTLQWSIRLVLLGAAVVFALGGPIPFWLARVFPSLSPLAAVSSSLAQRTWYLGLFWFAPPLLVLALAVWKGRLFCRWICPAGTLFALSAKLSLKKRILTVRVNGAVFWTIIFASVIGVPLFLILDPLAAFSRLTPLTRGMFSAAWLVPGLILPLFLVLGFIQPMIWCTHVCPLGYFLELCRRARERRPPARGGVGRTRREVLAGLLVGIPLAAALRRFSLVRKSYAKAPILPPGAKNQEVFASVCSRCYACVGVCPTRVIQVRWPTDRAIGQFFQPELAVDKTYCQDDCNRCSQVCPTGAIGALTLAEKQCRQIGLAKVIHSACLAWADGEPCMTCQAACPYGAIETGFNEDGVTSPIVNSDVCRGCGRCQNVCPAVREGKAIIVHGVERQRQLPADTRPVLPGRVVRVRAPSHRA